MIPYSSLSAAPPHGVISERHRNVSTCRNQFIGYAIVGVVVGAIFYLELALVRMDIEENRGSEVSSDSNCDNYIYIGITAINLQE